MKTYSHEDVKELIKATFNEVEHDLVHHIKYAKTDAHKHVAQLQALNLLIGGLNHKLEEALNGTIK